MSDNTANEVVKRTIEFMLGMLVLIFGIFLMARDLTRLLFERVLNPLTDNFFARNDGSAVFVSMLLWMLVGGMCILLGDAYQPGFYNSGNVTVQLWEAVVLGMGIGSIWGILIGGWLVIIWWSQITNAPIVVTDVTQLLNLPPSFYQGTDK